MPEYHRAANFCDGHSFIFSSSFIDYSVCGKSPYNLLQFTDCSSCSKIPFLSLFIGCCFTNVLQNDTDDLARSNHDVLVMAREISKFFIT